MKLHVIVPSTAGRILVRYFFLAVAIGCLGIYSFAWVERALYQYRASREFDRMPERVAHAIAASRDGITPVGSAGRSRWKSGLSPRFPLPGAPIGRLSVPRLHLSAMVREGVGEDTLQVAVGHIPLTPLPGEAGNVGVAGHRDTFFRGLKGLENGDEIQFSTASGDFRYVVESLMIVEPDNVAVLAQSAGNALTLVTCYPFSYIGAAPKRFVVRARQMSPQTGGGSSVE